MNRSLSESNLTIGIIHDIEEIKQGENNIVLLGDQSGGGSCAVIDATSAEGLYVRLSCPDHLQALDGTDYEFGVPADYKLVGDNNDFSNFFNISLMSSKIHEYYSR